MPIATPKPLTLLTCVWLCAAASSHAVQTVDPAAIAAIPYGLGPKAAVAAINTADRAAVTAAYNTVYNVPEPAAGFTGNVANCLPGGNSATYVDAIVTRLNYFRAMVGLPGNVTLDAGQSVNAQAAALMMSANNSLDHFPPASWRCFTAQGSAGAGASNLFLGVAGVAAVDGFLSDFGSGNEFVGHRRWLLFPPLLRMGVGDVTGGGAPSANAMAVVDFSLFGNRPAGVEFVPFPGRGFWPYQLLPGSGRWSVSVPGADFASAQVTVTVNGAAVNTPVIARDSRGFGDPTIVFTPQSALLTGQPANDVNVAVNVSNVTVGGQARNYAYSLTVFVPGATPSCTGAQDTDSDGVGDCLEQTRGTNPAIKDNNIFATDVSGNTRFIEQQFRDFLAREADAGGTSFWLGQLASGTSTRASLVESLLRSPEYDGLVAPMTRLYLGTYLRIPDYPGLQFWSGEYRRQPDRANLNRIAQAFATAPEFLGRYGSLDNAGYIARLYENILGRTADTVGLNFWIGELNRGVSRGDMLANFTESNEYVARVRPEATLINLSSAMLKRAPTQAEYDSIVPQLRSGVPTQTLADAIIRDSEYRRRFLP